MLLMKRSELPQNSPHCYADSEFYDFQSCWAFRIDQANEFSKLSCAGLINSSQHFHAFSFSTKTFSLACSPEKFASRSWTTHSLITDFFFLVNVQFKKMQRSRKHVRVRGSLSFFCSQFFASTENASGCNLHRTLRYVSNAIRLDRKPSCPQGDFLEKFNREFTFTFVGFTSQILSQTSTRCSRKAQIVFLPTAPGKKKIIGQMLLIKQFLPSLIPDVLVVVIFACIWSALPTRQRKWEFSY